MIPAIPRRIMNFPGAKDCPEECAFNLFLTPG